MITVERSDERKKGAGRRDAGCPISIPIGARWSAAEPMGLSLERKDKTSEIRFNFSSRRDREHEILAENVEGTGENVEGTLKEKR
jgi:hypothetical protein